MALLGAALGGGLMAMLLVVWYLGLGGPAGATPPFRGQLGEFSVHPTPKPTPDIHFTDANGVTRSLADFSGRVVLLNFWATWCAPCVEEMPALDRLQGRLGGPDFAVVAISIDRQGADVVAPFLEKLGIGQLARYFDRSGASMRAFALRGLPTTLLIDEQGREIGRLEGAAHWDSPQAEAFIRHFLPARQPTKT